MKIICIQDFERPLPIEQIKPNYKRVYPDIMFEKGKEYSVSRILYGMIHISNHNSLFYYFSLEENTKGVTPYFKDVYYGDYFEKI
jgi:hypothetical protein